MNKLIEIKLEKKSLEKRVDELTFKISILEVLLNKLDEEYKNHQHKIRWYNDGLISLNNTSTPKEKEVNK